VASTRARSRRLDPASTVLSARAVFGIQYASDGVGTAEPRGLTMRSLHLLFDGLILVAFALLMLALTVLAASGLNALLGT